jgi:hypothetical protein
MAERPNAPSPSERSMNHPALSSLMLLAFTLGAAGPAAAQTREKIPVEQDLQREEQADAFVEGRPPRPIGETRGLPVQSDPSGVAGFNGPPGGIGDSVGSYGALPQGAAGADIR